MSARVPECQKLKIVGQTSMANCKALTGWAVKGLTMPISSANITEINRRQQVTE